MRNEGICPQRRAYHVSFVHENKLYIHGGEDFHDGIIDSIWCLDLEFLESDSKNEYESNLRKPKWIPIVQPISKFSPGPLSRHAVVLYNSWAYVIGGSRPNGKTNSELYRFEIQSSKWEIVRQRDDLPGEREGHSCCLKDD